MESFDWRNFENVDFAFSFGRNNRNVISMTQEHLFIFSSRAQTENTDFIRFQRETSRFWDSTQVSLREINKNNTLLCEKEKAGFSKESCLWHNNKRPFLTLSKVSSRLSQFNDDVIYTLSQQTPSIFGRLIFSLATEERLWTPTGNLSRNSVPGLKFSEPNFN